MLIIQKVQEALRLPPFPLYLLSRHPSMAFVFWPFTTCVSLQFFQQHFIFFSTRDQIYFCFDIGVACPSRGLRVLRITIRVLLIDFQPQCHVLRRGLQMRHILKLKENAPWGSQQIFKSKLHLTIFGIVTKSKPS